MNQQKTALITGIGGQDGSYLADILLAKGYLVHGLHRRSSVDNLTRLSHHKIGEDWTSHVGDITDAGCMADLVKRVQPDEVYHEADQDHVSNSFMAPSYQVDVTIKGVLNVLEAVRQHSRLKSKVFIPLSATMFGSQAMACQTEQTPLNPETPYAIAKAAAWQFCKYYRSYFAVDVRCAILYNHDSPRRGPDYLLQKIARDVPLSGNLRQIVTIGHAEEFMQASVELMQLAQPEDVIIGSPVAFEIMDLVQYRYDSRFAPMSSTAFRPCYQPDITKASSLFGFLPIWNAGNLLRHLRSLRSKI